MSERERVRRPPIERTTPIRDWRGIFGAQEPVPAHPRAENGEHSGDVASRDHALHGEEPGESARSSGTGASAGGQRGAGGFEGAIARSVEIGYRVIDEYITQGQEAARTLREGRVSKETVLRDTGDLAARLARYASDFVGTWLELFELATTNDSSPSARERAHAAASEQPMSRPDEHAADAAPQRIVLSVVTARRVDACIQLDAAPRGGIRVHALRSADATLPRIDELEVVEGQDGKPATVRVTIDSDRAAGTYEGLLLDAERNVPIGVLRLTIYGEE